MMGFYMQIQLMMAFCAYSITVLCIGLFASRRNKTALVNEASANSFLLGNRSTHWLLTALSAHAADMSDWLFMGLPAAVYMHGGIEVWIPIGLLCGMFCAWQFIAQKLRIATEQYQVVTLASYFKKRFHDRSGLLISTAALISFFFFIIYIAVGIKGIGYVLQSAFNIPYHIGICIATGMILPYLLLGGFSSVAFLDLFQGMFLLCMLVIVPVCAYRAVGGWYVITGIAKARGIPLTPLPDVAPRTILTIILNPFAWCLGYFGMPHILTKFMGIAHHHELRKAQWVGLTWQFLATAAATAVGIVGIAYFSAGIPNKTEYIFIEMAKSLFPPFFAGLVLCAILAATISTIDSQLLVLASTVAEDFYKILINPHASQQQVRIVYRGAIVGGALLGLIGAWHEQSSIMELVKYAWAGLGASYGPVVLVALYSSYKNRYGICAGLITGAFVAGVWQYISPCIFGIEVYAMVPAFLSNLLAMYLVASVSDAFSTQNVPKKGNFYPESQSS
jgi:SSS family solute:Na+ symporter